MEYIFTLVGLLHNLNWIQLIALKLSMAAGVHWHMKALYVLPVKPLHIKQIGARL